MEWYFAQAECDDAKARLQTRLANDRTLAEFCDAIREAQDDIRRILSKYPSEHPAGLAEAQ